jgi:hypothetical protein
MKVDEDSDPKTGGGGDGSRDAFPCTFICLLIRLEIRSMDDGSIKTTEMVISNWNPDCVEPIISDPVPVFITDPGIPVGLKVFLSIWATR